MRALKSGACISGLLLLALGFLPVAAHADGLTLDGAPIDSVSFGTDDTFTVVMDSTDAAAYLTDIKLGTKIDLLTLDEFVTVDGTTTENVLEFAEDVVQKYQFTDTSQLTSDVTFSYKKSQITEGIPAGNGNTVPEPSSAVLLASSLLGLASFGRKKFNR
jgi:hypothetical protein